MGKIAAGIEVRTNQDLAGFDVLLVAAVVVA